MTGIDQQLRDSIDTGDRIALIRIWRGYRNLGREFGLSEAFVTQEFLAVLKLYRVKMSRTRLWEWDRRLRETGEIIDRRIFNRVKRIKRGRDRDARRRSQREWASRRSDEVNALRRQRYREAKNRGLDMAYFNTVVTLMTTLKRLVPDGDAEI